jgi:uncharacterized MAPEG superfamily protein
MSPITALVAAAALTEVMLLVGSGAKTRGNVAQGMGNRDDLPELTPFAARADRAGKNMIENLVLFIAVVVAAMAAGVPQEQMKLPCIIFIAARAAYAPIYWAGIKGVRSVVWAIAVFAMVWIGALALGFRL